MRLAQTSAILMPAVLLACQPTWTAKRWFLWRYPCLEEQWLRRERVWLKGGERGRTDCCARFTFTEWKILVLDFQSFLTFHSPVVKYSDKAFLQFELYVWISICWLLLFLISSPAIMFLISVLLIHILGLFISVLSIQQIYLHQYHTISY